MDGTVAVLSNELALVARATAEPTAFAAIYDHYFSRVYNYVRSGYLPTGYAFLDAMVAPSPDDRAFLFYSGPDGEIVLTQTPVYERWNEQTDCSATFSASVFWSGTDEPIEEVMLNGQRAAWVEGTSLMWEAEGIVHILGGANLSLDEATRIAESLK